MAVYGTCITSAVCNSIVVGLLHVAADYQDLRLVACVPGTEGGRGEEEDFCVFIVRYIYMT